VNMARPKIAEAEGWEQVFDEGSYKFVKIFTVTGPAKYRFHWYKMSADGQRNRYFYGETAQSEVQREAGALDWKIEREVNGWHRDGEII